LEQPTAVSSGCVSSRCAYDEAGHGFQLVKVPVGTDISRMQIWRHTSSVLLMASRRVAARRHWNPGNRGVQATCRLESLIRVDRMAGTLQARGYVTEVADTGPGQAIMYGTTPFLEKLPQLAVGPAGDRRFVPGGRRRGAE
jgi:hypothetical protein